VTYTTSRYRRKPRANWDEVKVAITEIEALCFGDKAWPRQRLAQEFNRATRIVILLWAADEADPIGYTVAEPWPAYDGQKTAYIGNTAIHPSHHGRGAVALMLRALYHELRAEGYAFVERDAAVANGYAWNIVKHALATGDLIEQRPHDSSYGPQLFIRMRVPSGRDGADGLGDRGADPVGHDVRGDPELQAEATLVHLQDELSPLSLRRHAAPATARGSGEEQT
jgi:hypothetical protein